MPLFLHNTGLGERNKDGEFQDLQLCKSEPFASVEDLEPVQVFLGLSHLKVAGWSGSPVQYAPRTHGCRHN